MSERPIERLPNFLVPLLISLPLLVYATCYVLSAPPKPPRRKLVINSGLSGLPESHRAREIYPEDYHEGGAYVNLPFGRTRYWLLGDEDGIKMVLIYGLLTPSIQWSQIVLPLVEKGFHVLVYDLYGRGYSDTPDTIYNAELYTTQLALLMHHVGFNRAVLCGFSMGGGIVAAFTHAFPQMVYEDIILISSAGVMEDEDVERAVSLMPTPVADAYFMKSPLKRLISCFPSLKASPKGSVDPVMEIVQLQCAHMPQHIKAVVSSLREGPVRGQTASFSSDQFKERRVQIIQGTNDPIVPFKYSGLILSTLPESTQKVSKIVAIPGGGHELPQTHPATLVNEICLFVFRGSLDPPTPGSTPGDSSSVGRLYQ